MTTLTITSNTVGIPSPATFLGVGAQTLDLSLIRFTADWFRSSRGEDLNLHRNMADRTFHFFEYTKDDVLIQQIIIHIDGWGLFSGIRIE